MTRETNRRNYDGPAIAHCKAYDALVADAKLGSMALLVALERTGQRP